MLQKKNYMKKLTLIFTVAFIVVLSCNASYSQSAADSLLIPVIIAYGTQSEPDSSCGIYITPQIIKYYIRIKSFVIYQESLSILLDTLVVEIPMKYVKGFCNVTKQQMKQNYESYPFYDKRFSLLRVEDVEKRLYSILLNRKMYNPSNN